MGGLVSLKLWFDVLIYVFKWYTSRRKKMVQEQHCLKKLLVMFIKKISSTFFAHLRHRTIDLLKVPIYCAAPFPKLSF